VSFSGKLKKALLQFSSYILIILLLACSSEDSIITRDMIIPRQVFTDTSFTFIPNDMYGDTKPKNLKQVAKISYEFIVPDYQDAQKVIIKTNGYPQFLTESPGALVIGESYNYPYITKIREFKYYAHNSLIHAQRVNITIISKVWNNMPNMANVVQTVFHPYNRTTLIIGIPGQDGMYVSINRSHDFIQSLYSSNGNFHHSWAISGFDYDYRGNLLKGRKRNLSPNYINNIIFAELLTAKFNIRCRELGIMDGAITTPSEFNTADSMLTFWKNYNDTNYVQMLNFLQMWNRHGNREIDTVSLTPLKLK